MQTEFPRDSRPTDHADDRAIGAFAPAPELTAEDVELIDLRYDQFVAQSELDEVMFESQ